MNRSDFEDGTERRTRSPRGVHEPDAVAALAVGEARLARALTDLVGPREPLLLAVSGGSDSVALMGVAARVHAGELHVVHVDHGARAESERDAAFVAELAARLGLPFHLERGAAAAHTETALRALRMTCLREVSRRLGVAPVLLGQHADDNRETLLLHALRGHSGLRARAGMPVWRPLDGRSVLVRPWLAARPSPGRRELAAWRAALGLPCRHDPMNDDPGIPRNVVRRVLADPPPALSAAALDGLRRRARGRLQAVLARGLEGLAQGLRIEGHGVVLQRPAWDPPADLNVDRASWRTELLRLLGASLEPAWSPDVSRGVLATLDQRLASRQPTGRLDLPGRPGPCVLRLSAAGVHLPERRLVDADVHVRGLLALARLPLP